MQTDMNKFIEQEATKSLYIMMLNFFNRNPDHKFDACEISAILGLIAHQVGQQCSMFRKP